VKGIHICLNEEPDPLQRGDNHKNVKMGGSYKDVLPNNKVNFNQSWYKSSLDEGDSSLFKQRRYPFSKGK
jgi:hypothetical protein